MTVDEIIAEPLKALGLPDGSIPLSILILCEYAEPGSDNRPSARRLATVSDDDMPPWTSIGMLRFATQLELDAVQDGRLGDEE
jgi:hypothetical protein